MGQSTPDTHDVSTGLATKLVILGPAAAHVAFVMELTLVPLLLPAMRAQFDFSLGELAWVFNAYSVAVAIGVCSGGLLGDRFETHKIFGYGVAVFMAGSLIASMAGNAEILIAGRMLQGLGAGVFSPLVPLLLTRAAPEKPGRVLILWGSLAGYIAAFAPLTFGSIFHSDNWNFAFLFIAAIAAIAVFANTQRRPLEAEKTAKTARPDYLKVFLAGKLWMTLGYVFITYGAITYFVFRLPLWLTEINYNAAGIGFLLSCLWLSFSAVSTLLRNKVDQHHIQAIVLGAPILIAIGVLLSYSTGTAGLLAAACLVGAGLACSNSPSTQLILRHAPKGLSAVSTSLDIALARFGGIAMVALLADINATLANVWICALCAVAGLFAYVISRGPALVRSKAS